MTELHCCYRDDLTEDGHHLAIHWNRTDPDARWTLTAAGPHWKLEMFHDSYTEARQAADRIAEDFRASAGADAPCVGLLGDVFAKSTAAPPVSPVAPRRAPWSFEPFEMDEEIPAWNVYDPNEAILVATFWDADEARAYLKWRNRRQRKAARKAAGDR